MRFLLYGLVLLATRLHAADASVTKQIEPDSPAIVFTRASGSVVLVKAEIGNIGNQAKNSALGGVSQGSGVIVAKDQIVTNLHVVAGATKIVVAIRGRELEAKVIAVTKKDRDLALLAVETKDGSRAILRKSTDLAVGERVFAIGNPRGYEQTLTDGLVSALRKEGTAFVILLVLSSLGQLKPEILTSIPHP